MVEEWVKRRADILVVNPMAIDAIVEILLSTFYPAVTLPRRIPLKKKLVEEVRKSLLRISSGFVETDLDEKVIEIIKLYWGA